MKQRIWWIVVSLLAISVGIFAYVYRAELWGENSMHGEHHLDAYLVSGKYEKFDESKLSLAREKTVVLFFSASWCPSCTLFNAEMKEFAETLPDSVLILAVDYDERFEMRKKYKVAYQHTFVVVDENGGELKRWSGGGVDRLKAELNLK